MNFREKVSKYVYVHNYVRNIERELLLKSNVKINSYVLDAGCGDGSFLRSCFGKRDNFIGIDIGTTTTVKGDIRYLPFKDNSFATIICNSALEHIYDYDLALREFNRVGRFLFLTVSNDNVKGTTGFLAKGLFRVINCFSLNDWAKTLRLSGFRVAKRTSYYSLTKFRLCTVSLLLFPLSFFSRFLLKVLPSSRNKVMILLECEKI
jgi:ubiquinone/menaquinone biosynthesis C-methylase UbiE